MTVNLAVLDQQEVVYIDRIGSKHMLNVYRPIGSRLPAYCTSTGKSLLAFLPAEQLQAALANMNWLQRTETTLSTPQALMDNLVLVRSRGFADSDGEMIPELQAVAAPIYQNNGQVVATVNISAPSHRVTHEKMVTEFAPEVVETAQKISMALGYYSEHKI